MKIVISVLLMSFLAFKVFASDLKKIEINSPDNKLNCKDSSSSFAGELYINYNKLTAIEKNDEITINFSQILSICTVKKNEQGENIFNSKIVNPYLGFDAQFYNPNTNSLDIKHEIIDENIQSNRLETLILIASNGSIIKSNLINSKNADYSVDFQFKLKVSDLLNPNDINEINNNKTIKKNIQLYTLLNTTTKISGVDYQFGNHFFPESNIVFIFSKN